MKRKKAIFFLFVFLSYIPVLAQVDTAWVRRYNGPANKSDIAIALAVDSSGNVYVTGYSLGSGTSWDYATIRYSPTGDTLWVRRYDGPGDGYDYAQALAVDGYENVYVTGGSFGSGTGSDYATIKYSATGDTLWVRRYNGPGNSDYAYALAVDDNGNVYVTGYSVVSEASWEYATIKYSPSGDTLWVRKYSGPGSDHDVARALAVDDSGNVYVTGYSGGSGSDYDYATIKYSAIGETLWIRRYNGPGNSFDNAYALAVDDSGNVYVTGGSVGNGTSSDYATIKYSAVGDTLWVRRYNGTGNGFDYAYALALDDSGNVYVTGGSAGIGNSPDYATIKYSAAGDNLWVRRYNGPGNDGDGASALALDISGNVYVTGGSFGVGTSSDFATIRYSAAGDSLWVSRYNGPGNDYDAASAIAVDGSGNLYVTGQGIGSGTSEDYSTIKYVQFTCVAKPGDANSDNNVLLSDVVTIINFLFKSQPAPNPSCRADANADGNVLLTDIVYLINFIFKSGPAPQKSRECCL